MREGWPAVGGAAVVVVAVLGGCASGDASTPTVQSPPDIVSVEYEQSSGPLGEGTPDGERPQTDPGEIAELADLLVRYDTLDTPARPEPTTMVACTRATLTAVRYVTVDGDDHELEASDCDPTPFDTDLGDLVAGWIADAGA